MEDRFVELLRVFAQRLQAARHPESSDGHKCIERKLDVNIVPVWTPRTHARIVTAYLGLKMSSSTHERCVDRDDLVKVFEKLNFVLDVDCMATRSNTLCEKFFSKIPQIGSSGVNFLSQELQPDTNYFCCPLLN